MVPVFKLKSDHFRLYILATVALDLSIRRASRAFLTLAASFFWENSWSKKLSNSNISYINEGGKAVLASYDGTKTTIVKSTSESSLMYGNPKVCVFNNVPYISYRNAVGNIIVIYKYENGSLIKVSNDMIIGKAYDRYRK